MARQSIASKGSVDGRPAAAGAAAGPGLLVGSRPAQLDDLTLALIGVWPQCSLERLPTVTDLLFRLAAGPAGVVLIDCEGVPDLGPRLPALLRALAPRWDVVLVGGRPPADTDWPDVPARLTVRPPEPPTRRADRKTCQPPGPEYTGILTVGGKGAHEQAILDRRPHGHARRAARAAGEQRS